MQIVLGFEAQLQSIVDQKQKGDEMKHPKLTVLNLVPPLSNSEYEVVVPDLESLIKFEFGYCGFVTTESRVTVGLSDELQGHALQLIGQDKEFRIVEYNGCRYLIAFKKELTK